MDFNIFLPPFVSHMVQTPSEMSRIIKKTVERAHSIMLRRLVSLRFDRRIPDIQTTYRSGSRKLSPRPPSCVHCPPSSVVSSAGGPFPDLIQFRAQRRRSVATRAGAAGRRRSAGCPCSTLEEAGWPVRAWRRPVAAAAAAEADCRQWRRRTRSPSRAQSARPSASLSPPTDYNPACPVPPHAATRQLTQNSAGGPLLHSSLRAEHTSRAH